MFLSEGGGLVQVADETRRKFNFHNLNAERQHLTCNTWLLHVKIAVRPALTLAPGTMTPDKAAINSILSIDKEFGVNAA